MYEMAALLSAFILSLFNLTELPQQLLQIASCMLHYGKVRVIQKHLKRTFCSEWT